MKQSQLVVGVGVGSTLLLSLQGHGARWRILLTSSSFLISHEKHWKYNLCSLFSLPRGLKFERFISFLSTWTQITARVCSSYSIKCGRPDSMRTSGGCPRGGRGAVGCCSSFHHSSSVVGFSSSTPLLGWSRVQVRMPNPVCQTEASNRNLREVQEQMTETIQHNLLPCTNIYTSKATSVYKPNQTKSIK